MNYTENDMAKLISEVESEFKEYLAKNEQIQEETEEEVIAKSEETSTDEFDYSEEEIEEMNEMYSSMNKAEAEAHYKALKSVVFQENSEEEVIAKSEEEVEEIEEPEEESLIKSEVEAVKAENEELKKNLETLTNIITKVVKGGAPKQKAITRIGQIEYIKKSEEEVEKKDSSKPDFSKMEKKEINKYLSNKIRSGELKKEEKELVDKYCFNEVGFKEIEHLL